MSRHMPELGTLVCVECGATADRDAERWRVYRADLPDEDEQPELVAYCPDCAAREFD
jgi:hypothetical protein